MKKTYMTPAMEVTEIAMVNMIAASSKVIKSAVDPSSSEAPFRGFDDEDLDLSDIKLW